MSLVLAIKARDGVVIASDRRLVVLATTRSTGWSISGTFGSPTGLSSRFELAAYRVVMNSILADGTGSIGIPVQLYEIREGVARIAQAAEFVVPRIISSAENTERLSST